jgi:hypothetical protein
VKLRSVVFAGAISVLAVAGLVTPATAAQRVAGALKADKCSLQVNIPHPHARQTETLTVTTTAAWTTVQVKIQYKTVSHNWKFETVGNKEAVHAFNVGHPTKGHRVTLNGKVTKAPRGYKTGATCGTSFVPD